MKKKIETNRTEFRSKRPINNLFRGSSTSHPKEHRISVIFVFFLFVSTSPSLFPEQFCEPYGAIFYFDVFLTLRSSISIDFRKLYRIPYDFSERASNFGTRGYLFAFFEIGRASCRERV